MADWEGKAIRAIPITQNRNGRRGLNLSTAKKLGLKLPPEAIMGAETMVTKK